MVDDVSTFSYPSRNKTSKVNGRNVQYFALKLCLMALAQYRMQKVGFVKSLRIKRHPFDPSLQNLRLSTHMIEPKWTETLLGKTFYLFKAEIILTPASRKKCRRSQRRFYCPFLSIHQVMHPNPDTVTIKFALKEEKYNFEKMDKIGQMKCEHIDK